MKEISEEVLSAIQRNFHLVIRERVSDLIVQHNVSLPGLSSLIVSDEHKEWFPVPGMYGGFSYWLETECEQTTLMVESWCRVVDGSGQRHRITVDGYQLVEEGFV